MTVETTKVELPPNEELLPTGEETVEVEVEEEVETVDQSGQKVTRFEDATAFLFDVKLKVPMHRANKENRADGKLSLEGNQCILLDCKSVEGAVNLQDHLDIQFDGYLRKERESNCQPLAFLVIGPAFTANSLKAAYQYKARTNWDIALITAEGLKYLAERWSAMSPEKPFPVRLLNRTEIIDKERAEFLLSLA